MTYNPREEYRNVEIYGENWKSNMAGQRRREQATPICMVWSKKQKTTKTANKMNKICLMFQRIILHYYSQKIDQQTKHRC